MKRLLAATVALSFLTVSAHGMGSKPAENTGDRKFNSTLEQMSLSANADPDGFVRQLSSRYNIPEQDIRQAMVTHGLSYPDIFMTTALARATGRPVFQIAEDYRKNPGRGWGVMARDMGIKPGSKEFQEMKRGARGCVDDMNSAARARQKQEQKQEQNTKHESRGKGRGKS